MIRHFNTTLVTVYPRKPKPTTTERLFQYNSCYCLSQIHTQELFRIQISIQLLLLFIGILFCAHLFTLFISIQLLLLFIEEQKIFMFNKPSFQYNSCYCLSNTFKPFFFFIIVSFSDKINVSLNFSQPPSIFSHFSPMWPQMAISRGLLTLIDFIGWEISKIFWQFFRLAVPKT